MKDVQLLRLFYDRPDDDTTFTVNYGLFDGA
jgi:hypothetical protein